MASMKAKINGWVLFFNKKKRLLNYDYYNISIDKINPYYLLLNTWQTKQRGLLKTLRESVTSNLDRKVEKRNSNKRKK